MATKQEMRYKLSPDIVAMGSEVSSLYHVTQCIELRGNTPMNTAKEEVRKMLDQIPDDVSYEDVQMARKVTWTESAWTDLEEVADYIAKDSRHYAGAGRLRDAVSEDNRSGQRPVGAVFKSACAKRRC
ncbi:MAG: hypothetical protein WCK00_01850 [Deltaproteobacteria bacterium]